jgi:hypothetical protein
MCGEFILLFLIKFSPHKPNLHEKNFFCHPNRMDVTRMQ